MGNPADPIGFEVTRVGQQPESIWADSCIEEGPPPSKYVFRKNGDIVFVLYAYATEREPSPVYRSHENQLNLWDNLDEDQRQKRATSGGERRVPDAVIKS